MVKKRMISLLLGAAMAGTIMTGCGRDYKDVEKDSLVFWSMWKEDEPQAEVIKEATQQFTLQTGIDVQVQFKGRRGQEYGLEKALEEGRKVDVFDGDIYLLGREYDKYLMNLGEIAASYETEHGNNTLFAIARSTSGGALKTIPYQPYIAGIFYNKDLFEKAGITKVPETWEELDAVCEKLLENDIVPITGDDVYMTSYLGIHMARFIGQKGVKALVGDPEMQKKVEMGEEEEWNWTDPRIKASLDALADFASRGYFSPAMAENKYPEGQQEFSRGDAAMIFCGSWLPSEVQETAGENFEWGYFNYPVMEKGDSSSLCNNLSCQAFGINKNCRAAEEAMEYISYLTTEAVDENFVQCALSIPVDSAGEGKWPEELMDVKKSFDTTSVFYEWASGMESNSEIEENIKESAVKLYSGQTDGQGFIENMTGEMKEE